MPDLAKFSEYGLIGLIIGVLFFILWRMLVWVMSFIKEIKNEHNEERKIWHALDVSKAKALDDLLANIKRHDEKADERGKYTRLEHEKMINNLDEQAKVLARINGIREK